MLLTAKGLDPESPGIILYDVNTTKQTILFTMAAVEGATPKLGDKVRLSFASCIVAMLLIIASYLKVNGTEYHLLPLKSIFRWQLNCSPLRFWQFSTM